jgi:hypothetical protein
MNASGVREQMQVFASDGQRVGIVVGVEDRSIKLARNSPEAGGEHHYIPLAWVETVQKAVYLSRPSEEVRDLWQLTPTL